MNPQGKGPGPGTAPPARVGELSLRSENALPNSSRVGYPPSPEESQIADRIAHTAINTEIAKPGGGPLDSQCQTEIDLIVADYLKAVGAGESPDRETILANHPDLGP